MKDNIEERAKLDLDQFYGSEDLHKHWSGLKYTEGVQYLCEQASSFWLLDAIAS